MNKQEKRTIAELLSLWDKLPFPKGESSAPIEGWQSFTTDMRQFKQAATEVLNGMACPEDIGDYYAPPGKVLEAIKEWMAMRAENRWGLKYDEIRWRE